jgi:FkbH-like protein
MITVCSKNNENDVLEAFSNHPFQLIKTNHLSGYRINWQDKVTNIQELSEELNIGLDSMVFIDDNPIERERVKQMLPMVVVPDFPDHPYLMSDFFKQIYQEYFQLYKLTNEDKNKTQQYVANSKRIDFKRAFQNVDDYLASLEMVLDIMQADKFTISRISQMTQKTNQFNLTTKRYSDSDIYDFLDQSALVYCLSVRDKFGDNGVTVASIILIKDGTAYIDSFLLSCRILGRNIESAYLDFLINLVFKKDVKTMRATYIPSDKNRQTEFFYDNNGFELLETKENGEKEYKLNIVKERQIKDYYKFKLLN